MLDLGPCHTAIMTSPWSRGAHGQVTITFLGEYQRIHGGSGSEAWPRRMGEVYTVKDKGHCTQCHQREQTPEE